jgi:ubiquinone/menaquinone biosynthesis C-methylase UbiE
MDQRARHALAPTHAEIAALPLSSNARIAAELISREGSRALDIGCGEGKFTRSLAKHFGTVKGIDVKANKIAQAQAAADKEGVAVVFETASGESIPEKDGSFDIVIFSNSLHHMPNPARALADAMRVLKSGGVLYVMEPVASGNYHDATCLVNDETQVRLQAYEAMRGISNAREEHEILYRARRVFDSFEEWRDDQIDRDVKRKVKFDEQPDLVRDRFVSSAHQEDGKLVFDQVFRVNLLRKS